MTSSGIFSNKKGILGICNHSANCDICQTTKQNIKNGDVEFLLSAHESGVYNFEGCRIPINANLIFQYIRSILADYKDYKICIFWAEFGFPLGYLGDD